MKKETYPYSDFVEYIKLCGKSELSAVSYASQVRRIIRHSNIDIYDLENIQKMTRDQVEDFLFLQRNTKNQTPFRRAWSCFRKFMESEGYNITTIDVIDLDWQNIPSNVADAIRALDYQQFSFRMIPRMTWDIDDKLSSVTGETVITVIYGGSTKKIVLPKKELEVITQWAYPDTDVKELNSNHYIVPRYPYCRHPMPVNMLRKVAGII